MPTSIITIITVLANILISGLGGQGVISAGLQKLISSLLTAASSLFTVFATGGSPTNVLSGVLTDLESLDTALASETNLSPTDLAQAQEAMKDLQAAIAAYQQAEQVTDPSTLTPLPVVE